MQEKKGISLIVLVITVIVMIILAATIMISLNNNGIFNKAEEATFKQNVKNYQAELALYMGEQLANNARLDVTTINATNVTTPSIKDMIPSITTDDELKFEVVQGALTYIGEDEDELKWAKDLGIVAPRLGTVVVTSTGVTEMTIQVTLARGENVKYTYSYRVKGSGNEYTVDLANTSNLTHTIDNLTGNTTYEVKVTATNEAGSSEYTLENTTAATLGELVKSSADYGKTINYTANGVTEWKVIRKETINGEDYIYIQTKYAIKHSKLQQDFRELDFIFWDPECKGTTCCDSAPETNFAIIPTESTPEASYSLTNGLRKDLWLIDGDVSIANSYLLDETYWQIFKNTTDYGNYVVGAIGSDGTNSFESSYVSNTYWTGSVMGDPLECAGFSCYPVVCLKGSIPAKLGTTTYYEI